jgi:hypothetical protein
MARPQHHRCRRRRRCQATAPPPLAPPPQRWCRSCYYPLRRRSSVQRARVSACLTRCLRSAAVSSPCAASARLVLRGAASATCGVSALPSLQHRRACGVQRMVRGGRPRDACPRACHLTSPPSWNTRAGCRQSHTVRTGSVIGSTVQRCMCQCDSCCFYCCRSLSQSLLVIHDRAAVCVCV